ncbi:hypothetical protein OG909_24880 [Streptomyces sp. NBC_01754]|uniref:zinc finger domain-containing protein n=1 Tax=Streptomyces sp. NBC_01754 TaxID=2975930 RepID=UPI002DDB620C|nr:hypothetical protein [Streptomyces sp. NBC_01754]WSC95251.1 hypothetical protein OG909_24880 [Streptomyces sp. NBC_01754]
MNTAEAGRLLMHAAAFDNRQPSATAAEAWAAALHNIPYDQDALAAVARYYSTPPARPGDRLWVQPHDIRTHRAAIRDERLDGFVYEPQPGDENPKTYLRNLRQQKTLVAGGHRPAAVRPALPPAESDRMKGTLALVGRTIPDDETPTTISPLSVACPQCAARLGQHCKKAGHPTTTPHTARTRVANGEPGTDPNAERAAEQRRTAAAAYLDSLTAEERAELEAFQQQMRGAS